MSIKTHIEQHLNQKIIAQQSVATGLFAAYKITLANGNQVFIKHQDNANQQLINEGKELLLLGKTIHTPKVLASCQQCLILEWIEQTHNPKLQSQAGFELALLHKNSAQYFGFDFDNKIGQTPQLNGVGRNISNWSAFYWEYRLLYQIQLAYQNQRLSKGEYHQLLKIENTLPSLLDNNIKPSLLHGDLWSGNLLSAKNNPYFIDTASYYGHREIDFALSFMFGGFDDDFYRSYNKNYQLDDGFDERKPLYMLYHYLNHLNLFGNTYHNNVMNCYQQLAKK